MQPDVFKPFSLKRKNLFLFVVLLFAFTKGYGQQFFASAASGQLQRVTITNGVLMSQVVTGCGNDYLSIAIYGGKIFYNDLGGLLFEADLVNGENATISNCKLIANGVLATSLTVDKNGTLYSAYNKELSKIDPATGVITKLGDLPYESAGDLVFYKDALYMASTEGIVKVSITHPEESTMFIPIADQTIYGLTTVVVNDEIKVYALKISGSNTGLGTELFELDMENKVIKGSIGNLNYVTYDAGSSSETGIIPIQVLSVNISHDCSVATNGQSKGAVQIINTLHTAVYTFTLNTGEHNHGGIFNQLDPGDYSITITSDDGGAPLTVPFTIPDFNLNKPIIIPTVKHINCTLPGSVTFTTSSSSSTTIGSIRYGVDSYNINDAIPVATPGINHFDIYDTNGCIIDALDVNVPQDICGDNVTFPNAFTPNGDGINDYFKPMQEVEPKDYKLLIFNRYGTQLFQSTTASKGWDGNYNGKPVPYGVYYWITAFITSNGAKSTQKGYVTLLR